MMKSKQNRRALLAVLVLCLALLPACGGAPAAETDPKPPVQTGTESTGHTAEPASPNGGTTLPPEPAKNETGILQKLHGAADETGIYSVIVTLSKDIAGKGEVEMVYYGPQGSPQENSVVNTYLIQYEKEDDGTFEISTFYDGALDVKLHHKEQVKVENTFGAAVRAGKVVIFYTPAGGEKQEIETADADRFRSH